MIKVFKVSMLFMHNNKYLPVTGLLTLLQWTIHKAGKKHREIFENFHKYFTKYFRAKKFMKFYITNPQTIKVDQNCYIDLLKTSLLLV